MTATWKQPELFMTDISHNLIGKIDNTSVVVLSEIDTISRDLKLDFFIKVVSLAGLAILNLCHGMTTWKDAAKMHTTCSSL
jgi:hypothetical protein